MKDPAELDLPLVDVLQIVGPLHGIPGSGLHWYLMYLSDHLDTLGMKRALADPCLLYRHHNEQLDGLVLLQVDDYLGLGSNKLLME